MLYAIEIIRTDKTKSEKKELCTDFNKHISSSNLLPHVTDYPQGTMSFL